MSYNHLELLRDGYNNLAKGDLPSVLALLHSDIEWVLPEGFPYGGTYRGPEEVKENVFMKLKTEWDKWSAVPGEFTEAGEKIIVLGKYNGISRETGNSFEAEFVHIWTFREGKAVKFKQFTDTALVQGALNKALI